MVLVREEVLRRGEYLALAVAQRMRTGAGMRQRHHDPQREKDKNNILVYLCNSPVLLVRINYNTR